MVSAWVSGGVIAGTSERPIAGASAWNRVYSRARARAGASAGLVHWVWGGRGQGLVLGIFLGLEVDLVLG